MTLEHVLYLDRSFKQSMHLLYLKTWCRKNSKCLLKSWYMKIFLTANARKQGMNLVVVPGRKMFD